MSISAKIYVDLGNENKNNVNQLMSIIKKSINEKLEEAYFNQGIEDYELNKSIPLIRNKTRLNDFSYNVFGNEKDGFMPSFYGSFKFFVDESEAHKVSNEDKIKIGENPSEIPHQNRVISIMPQGLNCDAEMHPIISKDIGDNSDFGVISMGSDKISIDILSYVSKQISKELNKPVYFNQNDSKYDLTIFKPDGRSTSYDNNGNIGKMELLSDKERNDRTKIAYSGKKPKQ